MNLNINNISRLFKPIWILILFLILITATAYAKEKEPPLFPEQELFKDATAAFLKWRSGDANMWKPMQEEYSKLLSGKTSKTLEGKCALEYGAYTEQHKRCYLRALAQSAVAFDFTAGETHEKAFDAFKIFFKFANDVLKIKPEQRRDYPAISVTSNDKLKSAADSMFSFGWELERSQLEDKGIITGDPICVSYTRVVPHYMKAKQYQEAATSAQSFLDYCLDTTNWIVNREQKYIHLGMLTDAYSATKEFARAVAAAKERYYLLPKEEAAESYLKLLDPKIDKAEIANISEYQLKIRNKIDRWFKLNPRPINGELSDYLAYDQRKVSLYKNALDATEKLGLKGYDPYLFSEYEFLVKSVASSKGVIKAINASNESERKQQADSEKSIGDFFDILDEMQKLRR